jgi:hypothetical protein
VRLSWELVPHSVHECCHPYRASVGNLSLPLFSLQPTQPLLYSLKPCELTKGWPSHEVFRDWRKGTCGPLTTWLVRWLQVLDTCQSQRQKTFALYLRISFSWYVAIVEEWKMCFWRRFVSFENEMLHTSLWTRQFTVSQDYGRFDPVVTLVTGTQLYNTRRDVSNRHLYLFLLMSPSQLRLSTKSEWCRPLSTCR